MKDESNQPSVENAADEPGMTLISIPTDKVDAVLAFLQSLDDDGDDVSGHMLGGGILKSPIKTMTGASQTGGPAIFEADYSSSDSDLG
jgi:hypothetical protein